MHADCSVAPVLFLIDYSVPAFFFFFCQPSVKINRIMCIYFFKIFGGYFCRTRTAISSFYEQLVRYAPPEIGFDHYINSITALSVCRETSEQLARYWLLEETVCWNRIVQSKKFWEKEVKRKGSVIGSSFLHGCMLEALGIFESVDGSLEHTFVKKDYNLHLQSWKDWSQYCLTNLSL